MAVTLQGGSFDKPDRLFLSVENSWLSASQENLQDVRELIPEFFYLPEFLSNHNKFDLGTTQREALVKDVALPPWARGDPKEFIRIHREALESKYVSENLHHWIDLIFGFKQRGKAAMGAMNVFIHLTYEGEVDIDAITDVVMRNATISQINNFGQTPSKIFSRPHPRKIVPDIAKKSGGGSAAAAAAVAVGGSGSAGGSGSTSADPVLATVDQSALNWHSHLCAPLCVVGAPRHNMLSKVSYAQVSIKSYLLTHAPISYPSIYRIKLQFFYLYKFCWSVIVLSSSCACDNAHHCR